MDDHVVIDVVPFFFVGSIDDNFVVRRSRSNYYHWNCYYSLTVMVDLTTKTSHQISSFVRNCTVTMSK